MALLDYGVLGIGEGQPAESPHVQPCLNLTEALAIAAWHAQDPDS